VPLPVSSPGIGRTQLRLIGQKHRDKERERLNSLHSSQDSLKEENKYLRMMYANKLKVGNTNINIDELSQVLRGENNTSISSISSTNSNRNSNMMGAEVVKRGINAIQKEAPSMEWGCAMFNCVLDIHDSWSKSETPYTNIPWAMSISMSVPKNGHRNRNNREIPYERKNRNGDDNSGIRII